jgi:hypothetical protein
MSDDAKRTFTKEYGIYLRKKYDNAFLNRAIATARIFTDITDRSSVDSRVKEAFYAVGLTGRLILSPWKRFLRPEWAMSVVSAGGTCCAKIIPVPIAARPSSTFDAPLAEEGVKDLTALFTWPQIERSFGGELIPSQMLRYNETHFFLEDGRVHKYFSGRMLSLVVSSLSRC